MDYINLKNGKTYDVISSEIINATNAQDGQQMVAYIGENVSGKKIVYVRELKEFNEKFVLKR